MADINTSIDKEQESKSKRKSLLITVVCSLFLLLAIIFLKITLTEETKTQYIAVNFGNTGLGDGPAEPEPAAAATSTPSQSSSTPAPKTPEPLISDSQSDAVISSSPEKTPQKKTEEKKVQPKKTENKKTEKKTESKTSTQSSITTKEKGKVSDGRGKAALGNLLGGKGKAKSSGQGSGGSGNQGDPAGLSSFGNGGRRLVSKIPVPQYHDCPQSGKINVEYVVDQRGRVKSARIAKGSTSTDACLQKKAIELVKKFVRASEGANNDRAVYTVVLE